MAEWLGRGLQSLVHQFDSGRRLCPLLPVGRQAIQGFHERARGDVPALEARCVAPFLAWCPVAVGGGQTPIQCFTGGTLLADRGFDGLRVLAVFIGNRPLGHVRSVQVDGGPGRNLRRNYLPAVSEAAREAAVCTERRSCAAVATAASVDLIR